jgi:hypothetical protein
MGDEGRGVDFRYFQPRHVARNTRFKPRRRAATAHRSFRIQNPLPRHVRAAKAAYRGFRGCQVNATQATGELDCLQLFEQLGGDEILKAAAPIQVDSSITVQPFTMAHFRLLWRLEHYWYTRMNQALNNQPQEEDLFLGDVQYYELAFIITRPVEVSEELLHQGREHFRAHALRTFDHIPVAVFKQVIEGATKQQAATGKLMRAKLAQLHGSNRRGPLARAWQRLTGGRNG